MNFERIIITGDFFRYKPDDEPGKPTFTHGNIEWLYDLLAPVIQRASGKFVNYSYGLPEDFAGINIRNFNDWVKRYNCTDVTGSQGELIAEYCGGEDTLIIGFELSLYQRFLFSNAGTSWISLAISPIRFGIDYYFTFTTNCTNALIRTLNPRAITDYELRGYADYLKAKYNRFSTLELVPGSVLFCGQVANDASLIEGDHMANVSDYLKDIQGLAEKYPHLYYKRHPYAEDDYDTICLIESLPNASIIDADVYELLSRHEIHRVAALSSSVLTEASYFGKQAMRLLHNERRELSWTIDKHILTPNFWADILGYPRPDRKDPLVLQEQSPIRDALKVSWKHKGES